MNSQVALSSVFRFGLTNLCSTFSYLYLLEHNFLQVKVVCKDDFHIPCVFMLHFRRFFSQKTNKRIRIAVIIVCSVLKTVSFIFYRKEMMGNSLIKYWLDMDLRRCKEDGYVALQNFLWSTTNGTFCSLASLKKLYSPCVCIIGYFSMVFNNLFVN